MLSKPSWFCPRWKGTSLHWNREVTIWNGSGEAEALSDESSGRERSRWEPRYHNFLGETKKTRVVSVVLRVGVMLLWCCTGWFF